MLNKFDIFLFSVLLLLYIIINNNNHYFIIIYISIALYYLYKLYRHFRFDSNKTIYYYVKIIITYLMHFLFSYLLIYDHNPLYYLFTFYLPFENFFRAIFLIMFHSYSITKFEENINKKENQLINGFSESDSNNKVQILNSENSISKENDFFLSYIFYYFKQSKKKLAQFIAFLIIIKIILFYYNDKLWIYFRGKENILPISTFRNTKYYITACVLNMEPIIVDYINEIKKLINYLGEKNIIISIVENGDSKDKTREYLKEFSQFLDSKNISNKFVLTHETEDPRGDQTISHIMKKYLRIKYLATLRNRCFDFLYQIPDLDFNNLKIINLNDIVFTFEDVIKLLSTNKEDYDVVCAMDYFFNFYDTWVSIDLDGSHLLGNFPYFINKEGQDQYINKKPIRVFSCWNGIVAFNGSAFKNKNIQFRVESINDPNRNISLFRLKTDVEDVYESECTYFHIDMENLGFKKRFINSEVRVAYNYKYYYFSKYILPNTFEFIFYFKNYLKSFTVKRNKNMSNLKDKNLTYPSILKNWYVYRKLNHTNTELLNKAKTNSYL